MNKKEIAEIKKALPNCISKLGIGYVNADGNVVESRTFSPVSVEEPVLDDYVALLKNGLTGKPEAGLLTLEFPAEEEAPEGKQSFMLRLLKSRLNNKELFDVYVSNVASCYDIT